MDIKKFINDYKYVILGGILGGILGAILSILFSKLLFYILK